MAPAIPDTSSWLRTVATSRVLPAADVVAPERLDECCRDSVGFATPQRIEARRKPKAIRKIDAVVGSVAAAIVDQPLGRMRRTRRYKLLLRRGQYDIANHLS